MSTTYLDFVNNLQKKILSQIIGKLSVNVLLNVSNHFSLTLKPLRFGGYWGIMIWGLFTKHFRSMGQIGRSIAIRPSLFRHFQVTSIIMVCDSVCVCVHPPLMSSPPAAKGPIDMISQAEASRDSAMRGVPPYILHTIRSVYPPHGPWPAPMGSWRVYIWCSWKLTEFS